MYVVSIDQDKCQGCGECVASCPAEIISQGDDGKATVSDPTDCQGCETCVTVCAYEAVTVTEY